MGSKKIWRTTRSIFEAHGYRQSVQQGEGSVSVTYRKREAARADRQAILVRVYRANQQADALADFEHDAERLALDGYSPVTQSWAPGQWGCGAFLVALALCLVLIGIVVFIYMLIVKPDGTLTVTYELRQARATVEPTSAPTAKLASTVADRLRHLEHLKAEGLVNEGEYQAKRTEILSQL